MREEKVIAVSVVEPVTPHHRQYQSLDAGKHVRNMTHNLEIQSVQWALSLTQILMDAGKFIRSDSDASIPLEDHLTVDFFK